MRKYRVKYFLLTLSLLPYLSFAASTQIVNKLDFPEESIEKLPYRVGYIISEELEQHEFSVHYDRCDRTFIFDNSDLHSKLIRTSLKNTFEDVYRSESQDLKNSNDLILAFGIPNHLSNNWWQSHAPCSSGLDDHEIWFAYSIQIVEKEGATKADPTQIFGYGKSPRRSNRRGFRDASEQAFLNMQSKLNEFYKNNVTQVLDEIIDQLTSSDETRITSDSNSITLPQSSVVEDLQSLVDMYEEGLLTEAQFMTAKELRLNQ